MRQALAFHEQGLQDDAERLCRAVLRAEPSHFDALHLLAIVKLEQGKCEEAEKLFGDALRSNPNEEGALCGRGRALLALGRPHDALESFEKALAVTSHSIVALCGRANALQALGKLDAAIAGHVEALAIRPDHVDSLCGLGHALDAQGRVEEALAAYEKAIAAGHEDAAVLSDRANALFKLGRYPEAMAGWDRVLAVDADNFAAYAGRGNVFYALNSREAALAEYDRAIELSPDFAGAPYNRAVVLSSLGRYDEAIAAYQWAIAIKPDFVQALFNCAVLQGNQGRHDDALGTFEQLLAIDPDYPHAAGNVALEQGKMCFWERRSEVVERVLEGVNRGKPVSVPLPFLALSQNAAAQRACAANVVENHHPPSAQPKWAGEVYRHDRIRVAYLSADFHEHAVGFLIAGLLEQHDHDRFEITGIVFGPDRSSFMRSRIEGAFDQLVDARNRTDADVASMLREREIDIAVDLMGFTADCRTSIFAFRAAPVQVNYLGYPGTMGAAYMDYILADRFVIPDARRSDYAENVVYLPDTFQVTDAKRRIADVTPSRSDAGLPHDGFVFCCFNGSYKITPEMFAVWLRLLERVPGSVLWLVAGNKWVEANLRREAQKCGVAPSRLVFSPRLPSEDYLAQYRLADVFLDTLPFNGGATVSDALWAGLPVLTCAGEAFAARMAGSLLLAIGLPELITHSLAEYESVAFQLATDAPRLAQIKQRLAGNRVGYPLFDTDRFRRNIEAAYVTMWEKSQRGEPPGSFAVPAAQPVSRHKP